MFGLEAGGIVFHQARGAVDLPAAVGRLRIQTGDVGLDLVGGLLVLFAAEEILGAELHHFETARRRLLQDLQLAVGVLKFLAVQKGIDVRHEEHRLRMLGIDDGVHLFLVGRLVAGAQIKLAQGKAVGGGRIRQADQKLVALDGLGEHFLAGDGQQEAGLQPQVLHGRRLAGEVLVQQRQRLAEVFEIAAVAEELGQPAAGPTGVDQRGRRRQGDDAAQQRLGGDRFSAAEVEVARPAEDAAVLRKRLHGGLVLLPGLVRFVQQIAAIRNGRQVLIGPETGLDLADQGLGVVGLADLGVQLRRRGPRLFAARVHLHGLVERFRPSPGHLQHGHVALPNVRVPGVCLARRRRPSGD